MEEFGAQDGSAVPVSLDELDGCQVFVGVYARRYGYVPPGSAKGVTELEYNEAERSGLPRLVFVVAPEYTGHPLLEDHRDDSDPAQADRLRQFLERVGAQRVWDTFTTPEHLANRVAFAISRWEGWRPPRPRPARYRYIGRDDLLRQLDDGLRAGRRVALVGMAGIGKTLTAAEVAIRAAGRYAGGVFWVGLGTEARDPKQVVQITMRSWAACHHPGRLADPSNLTPDAVREWLSAAPGPVLVVLDDVWHARVGVELLRLVPDSATVLVTTRRADAARQLGIDPLTIDRLTPDEAIALLRDRVGDLPSLTALRRIVDQLAGHPLALEIVAARIAAGPPDLAESLPDVLAACLRDDPGGALAGLEADLESPIDGDEDRERYASLGAALRLTYDTFAEDLKRRFRATGPLAPDAPLSEPLLAAVWGDDLGDGPARQEFQNRMAAFASASVLTRDGRAFTRHALVRLYALAAARRAGEDRTVDDRYVAYVLDSVLTRLNATAPDKWDAELGDELPHIHFVGDRLAGRLVGDRADTAAGERMRRFAAGIERYLEHHREVSGVGWLEAAAAACAAAGDVRGQVRFLNALAGSLFARRDSRNGVRPAYQAWQLASEHKDELGQARAALFLGYLYTHTDPWEAPRYFEGAARQFKAMGDRGGQVDSLIQLAGCKADHINPPPVRREGVELLREAAAVARSSGYRLGEVRAMARLGALLETCADYPAARAQLEEAVAAARALGSKGEEAMILVSLAAVLADLGELAAAEATLEAAVRLFEAVGDRVGRGTALRNAAQVAELRGDPAQAAELFVAALAFVRKRTMLELDAFSDDDMRATPTLAVRLDDILFNDTREQFRAKASEELFARDVEELGREQAELKWGVIGGEGPMPEDVWGFLARQTIRAAAGTPGDAAAWLSVLARVADGLAGLGAYWAVDADFARALVDVTASRPDTLPESHAYYGIVRGLRARVERSRQGLPTYGPDELRYFLGNTLAVRTSAKDKLREWTAELRRTRQDAVNWGDFDAAELLHALLGVAVDRLASVSPDSPYADPFEQLLDHLGGEGELLADYIERASIAVKLATPDQLPGWCAKLDESRELAVLWRDRREEEYLRALLEVLSDRPAALPAGHVYGPSLAYVSAAVAAGMMPPGIPGGHVRQMVAITRAAGAEDTSGRDRARRTFLGMIRKADAAGDAAESEFFRAMLAVASGELAELPLENPYRIYLEARLGFVFHSA
jgi:tetratricopeptide (TPR) repeat protein